MPTPIISRGDAVLAAKRSAEAQLSAAPCGALAEAPAPHPEVGATYWRKTEQRLVRILAAEFLGRDRRIAA